MSDERYTITAQALRRQITDTSLALQMFVYVSTNQNDNEEFRLRRRRMVADMRVLLDVLDGHQELECCE